MHPHRTALLTLFTTGILGISTAQASSILAPVIPNQPVNQGWQFNVQRQIDKNPQQYQFTVEIIPQNVPLPAPFSAALSLHKVTPHGESIEPLRAVPCEQTPQRIRCHFTAPIKATHTPELVFLLDMPVVIQRNGKSITMPSTNMLYFPLKNAVSS
jgi:hypothetical protein